MTWAWPHPGPWWSLCPLQVTAPQEAQWAGWGGVRRGEEGWAHRPLSPLRLPITPAQCPRKTWRRLQAPKTHRSLPRSSSGSRGSAELDHGRCFGVRLTGSCPLSSWSPCSFLPGPAPPSCAPTSRTSRPKCHPLAASGCAAAGPRLPGTLTGHKEGRVCAWTRSAVAVVCRLLCGCWKAEMGKDKKR